MTVWAAIQVIGVCIGLCIGAWLWSRGAPPPK